MKRDSTVFTHRHLISTFFGFVSREKKLEGIANITHTRETMTTTMSSARKSKCCGQYLRDEDGEQACSFTPQFTDTQTANAARETEDREKLDFFILHTNKKSSRKFVPCSYIQCNVKEKNKTSNVVVSFKVSIFLCLREKVMLAETVGTSAFLSMFD